MKTSIGLVTAVVALLGAAEARAAPCKAGEPRANLRKPERGTCTTRPAERLVPYDASAARERAPGLIDLGSGTEVRVSGRIRAEGRFGR